MIPNLTASTSEYARSSCRRNRREAAFPASGPAWTIAILGDRSNESRKPTAEACPARPRKNVQASPTTQLLQTSRPWPSSQSCFASAWCESRGTSSAIQKLVSTNLTIRRPPRRCPWDRYRRCQSRQSADHCIVDSRSRAVTRLDAFSDQRSLGPIVLGHFRPESLVEIFFNIFFNINLYTPHAMSTHSSSRPRLCGQRRAGAPTVSRPGLKGIEGREPPTSQTSDLPGNWKRRSAGEPVPKPVGRDMSGCSGSGRPVYAEARYCRFRHLGIHIQPPDGQRTRCAPIRAPARHPRCPRRLPAWDGEPSLRQFAAILNAWDRALLGSDWHLRSDSRPPRCELRLQPSSRFRFGTR